MHIVYLNVQIYFLCHTMRGSAVVLSNGNYYILPNIPPYTCSRGSPPPSCRDYIALQPLRVGNVKKNVWRNCMLLACYINVEHSNSCSSQLINDYRYSLGLNIGINIYSFKFIGDSVHSFMIFYHKLELITRPIIILMVY